MVMAVVTSREEADASLLNPLHSGVGSSFSDAFLLLAIPVMLAMALSLAIPRASRLADAGLPVATQPESLPTSRWVANCSVPWMPECVEAISRAGPEGITPITEDESKATT